MIRDFILVIIGTILIASAVFGAIYGVKTFARHDLCPNSNSYIITEN